MDINLKPKTNIFVAAWSHICNGIGAFTNISNKWIFSLPYPIQLVIRVIRIILLVVAVIGTPVVAIISLLNFVTIFFGKGVATLIVAVPLFLTLFAFILRDYDNDVKRQRERGW